MEISRRRAKCDAETDDDAARTQRMAAGATIGRRPRGLRRRSGRAGRRRRRRRSRRFARFVDGRAHVQHCKSESKFDLRRRQRRPSRKPLRDDAAAGQHGSQRHGTRPRLVRRLIVGGRCLVAGNSLGRGWHDSQLPLVAPKLFVFKRDSRWPLARTARLLCHGGLARAARRPGGFRYRRAAAGHPSPERREHRRFDAMGLGPCKRLGWRVAAAVGEALFGRGAATGFVHAGKRPRAILAGQPLRSGRFRGGRRDDPERQREARGHERVAENRQPCREPTKRCVRVHGSKDILGGVQKQPVNKSLEWPPESDAYPVSPGFRRGLPPIRAATPSRHHAIRKPGAEATGLRVHAARPASLPHDPPQPCDAPGLASGSDGAPRQMHRHMPRSSVTASASSPAPPRSPAGSRPIHPR